MSFLEPILDAGRRLSQLFRTDDVEHALGTDLFRFAVILALSVVLAYGGVRLVRRALVRRGGVASRRTDELNHVLTALRGLVLLFGLYEAVKMLPLKGAADRWIDGICYVLAILAAARLFLRGARLGLHEFLDRHPEPTIRDRVQREYVPIATTALTVGVALLAVILIARHFDQDVGALLTAFGVGSLAIGLAAQATLGNTIAGFIILIDQPFRVGDRVRLVSGDGGEIREIGIRSTRILLSDGDLLVVPNAELLGSRVVNLSQPTGISRAEVKVRVAHAGLAAVTELLMQGAEAEVLVLKEGEGVKLPSVAVAAIEGRNVDLVLRFHVASELRSEASDRVRRFVAERLLPEHLSPPAAS